MPNAVCANTLATDNDVPAELESMQPSASELNARLQDVSLSSRALCQASGNWCMHRFAQQFQSVFPVEMPASSAGLPPDRGISHAILMQTNQPVPASKMYRLSKPQREEMDRQIKSLLSKGWIRPSSSPYGSPLPVMNNNNGGTLKCVDCRTVNNVVTRTSSEGLIPY